MASRQLPARLRGSYICPSCQHRSFSTTGTRSAIAPESPRYIDIPEPPQQTKPDKPSRKGVLPIPRDIARRTSASSIKSATRAPSKPHAAPTEPRLAFKAAQSALRKSNLSSGYTALSNRRAVQAEQSRTRRLRNRDDREALLSAPEHPSDRLTSITLDPSVRTELNRLKNGSQTPDPDRDARIEATRRHLAALELSRQEARQDALHTLYMNARTFIVDEDGLNKAIDRAFGTEDQPKDFGVQPSMWAKGAPPRMQDMVASQGGTGGRDQSMGGAQQAADEMLKTRIRRMGEVLTGGRMDP
ncbi:hypothetical protein CAC42_6347 [Sphaceloma murrayae]|uniref:Uncharacterized protein n=1 Tax=Sphaceloma murrayae TaxID=2082308 RepID=A0A2K1QMZ8_9PEZI|nr:hypothetical protein CAC42_6347 [Sphaceloma murrayae]